MLFIKKYLIHILISIITLSIGWNINLSLKTSLGIMSLKKQIQLLQNKNKSLLSKNKNFESRNKNLLSKNKNFESRNKNLLSKNKNFESKNKNLLSKNKNFESRNKNLLSKNYKLIERQKKIKIALKEHRDSSINKLANRVKIKVATVPTKAIPFIGVASIIGMSVTDIKDYCNDINEIKDLERFLFNDTPTYPEDEKVIKLCSQDYETIKSMILEKVGL